MKKQTMTRWLLPLLAAALLGLSACGGSASEAAASGSTAETTAETTSGEESQAAEAGGSAAVSADGVYEIATADDFVAYAQAVKEETLALPNDDSRIMTSAVLTADIDMTGVLPADSDLLPLGGPYTVEVDGEETAKFGQFSGTFDGAGHTISGLQVEPATSGLAVATIDGAAGLFGEVGGYRDATGTVCDLTIANSTFVGANNAGAFAAMATRSALFENCTVAADVTVTANQEIGCAGGLVGQTYNGDQIILRGCVSQGTINGANVGDLVGVAGDKTSIE